MSNKFLSTNGTGDANLNDGTTPIFASTLGASSFTPSTALKTNASGLITSTDLDIADVTGLSSELDSKLNLSGGTLTGSVEVVDNLKYVTELEMEHQNAHTTPGSNSSFMYVKTDNKLYLKDSDGNEVEVGGGGDYLPLTGGTLTGDLVVDDSILTINGATKYLELDDSTTRSIIRAYGSAYIDDATSRSYSFNTSADGVVHNFSNTAQEYDFQIFSDSKLVVTDTMTETTTPLLVTDGTILLEPSASASATTGTSTEIFSDSGSNNNLTFVDNSIEYPIAGQQLITVKYSKRFAGNVAQTLYTDTNMEFLWDATNLQVQFKPLTYVSNYVDACILFVPGNANNTVKDNSGDVGFVNGSVYYFSDDGLIDTGFNMSQYGARQFLAVCPEGAITSESPCYRLDLVGGNSSNMNITIEKQSV